MNFISENSLERSALFHFPSQNSLDAKTPTGFFLASGNFHPVVARVFQILARGFFLALGFGRIVGAEPTPEEKAFPIVLEMLSQRPIQSGTNLARLKLREGDGPITTVPVTIITEVRDDFWQLTYRASGGPAGHLTNISILYRENQAPRYVAAVQKEDGLVAVRDLGSDDIHQPLAGTDFWISDLGLGFLHWPKARWVRDEPHSTRMCHLIEFNNPGGKGYASVLAWVDVKEKVILGAEALDARRQVLKRFHVRSVDSGGVREIRIRDLKKNSLTELLYQAGPTP